MKTILTSFLAVLITLTLTVTTNASETADTTKPPAPDSLLLPAVQKAIEQHPGELGVMVHELGHVLGLRTFLSIFADGFESGNVSALHYETIRWDIKSGIADFTPEQWFRLWADEAFMKTCSKQTRVYIDDIIIGLTNQLIINLSIGVWDDADIVH